MLEEKLQVNAEIKEVHDRGRKNDAVVMLIEMASWEDKEEVMKNKYEIE